MARRVVFLPFVTTRNIPKVTCELPSTFVSLKRDRLDQTCRIIPLLLAPGYLPVFFVITLNDFGSSNGVGLLVRYSTAWFCALPFQGVVWLPASHSVLNGSVNTIVALALNDLMFLTTKRMKYFQIKFHSYKNESTAVLSRCYHKWNYHEWRHTTSMRASTNALIDSICYACVRS